MIINKFSQGSGSQNDPNLPFSQFQLDGAMIDRTSNISADFTRMHRNCPLQTPSELGGSQSSLCPSRNHFPRVVSESRQGPVMRSEVAFRGPLFSPLRTQTPPPSTQHTPSSCRHPAPIRHPFEQPLEYVPRPPPFSQIIRLPGPRSRNDVHLQCGDERSSYFSACRLQNHTPSGVLKHTFPVKTR
jgi:hypothetical protein